MNAITNGARNLFNFSVCLLKKPAVQAQITTIISTSTFFFSVYRIIAMYKTAAKPIANSPKWILTIHKIIEVCTTISLVLSIGVSIPGAFIISSIIGCVFSTQQLNRIFGPNTAFNLNPYHPRHIISIAAMVFAIPSFLQTGYISINWIHSKIHQHERNSGDRV